MIYFVLNELTGHIKIGFTEKDHPDGRLGDFKTGNPSGLRVLHTMPGDRDDEGSLHRLFAYARHDGEWFKPVPELLALIPPQERLACGKVEVVERSVQIRVLTVGRKQVTKNLIEQLPETIAYLRGGVVWGWVAMGHGIKYLVYVFDGTLYKCPAGYNELWMDYPQLFIGV